MDLELLGWPADGPTLRLDHRQFSYAGKFVMSTTGKAVARGDADGAVEARDEAPTAAADERPVVGAVAFDEDREAPDTLRVRYVTVRADRRGEGIGPRLLAFACERARERGYDRVDIGVNNPFAYEAAYRAGFAFTGERTGLAELVCVWPAPERSRERYQSGLDRYRERDLSAAEREFLDRRADADPPAPRPWE